MNTIFLQIGTFCIALVFAIYFQIYEERKKSKDCLLFGRLLLATAMILFIDTVGWMIDGNPIAGQVWITTVVDGLDLIITTTVCWCWVQYAVYIARGDDKKRPWHQSFMTVLLVLQIGLVVSSQFLGFYYSVDASGVYHRESWYTIHSTISLIMLLYSSLSCLFSYEREENKDRKKELLFVAMIILIPILGNIFQLYVYGYPTVWICMVFMIFIVYVHIQNKRINAEREHKNAMLEKALEEAQNANHAKTDFLSHMSHDMRTPMNGILGLAGLSEQENWSEVLKENIRQMRESRDYLLSLINDTLDFQRIESGK